MHPPQPPGNKQNHLTAAFRTKLRKITDNNQTTQTTTRVQQVMLALGYAMALTPTGNPGFTRLAMYKGTAANVWVADTSLTAWPQSLLSAVWVGYYTPEEPKEMIQYMEFDRLMDYLQEYHPEAFQVPSELGSGEG